MEWAAGSAQMDRCFKTRVLGRRLPNGKPQERLRFRALRSKTLAFKERIAIIFLRFKDFPRGQDLRLGPLRSKSRRFAFAFLSPLSLRGNWCPLQTPSTFRKGGLSNWLFAQKPFETQIAQNHPKPPIFLKSRRCAEIIQDFPLNSY